MRRSFTRQCPQCTQHVTWPETPTYPFCSERCRLLDLGVWASEGYRLPGEAISEDDLQSHLDGVEDDETSFS